MESGVDREIKGDPKESTGGQAELKEEDTSPAVQGNQILNDIVSEASQEAKRGKQGEGEPELTIKSPLTKTGNESELEGPASKDKREQLESKAEVALGKGTRKLEEGGTKAINNEMSETPKQATSIKIVTQNRHEEDSKCEYALKDPD